MDLVRSYVEMLGRLRAEEALMIADAVWVGRCTPSSKTTGTGKHARTVPNPAGARQAKAWQRLAQSPGAGAVKLPKEGAAQVLGAMGIGVRVVKRKEPKRD